MIVASIDPLTGGSALFGVPRNYGAVTLTDGTAVPVRRLNHVYNWGQGHPEAFGGVDPGASAVADAVGYITGLEMDYFVLVDLTGFAEVIDLFGGVSLVVADPVNGPLYDPVTGGYEMVQIAEGAQRLDGGHALAYARARYGSTDYARMARQRCILTALAGQADPLALLTRLPDLLGVVEENLTTDMPIELVPELVRLLLRVSAENIDVIGFDSSWSTGWSNDGHPIPDLDRIRAAVRQTIEDPGAASSLGVAKAGEACG
jgi:LCP family protein required for cell wall assembly